MKILIAPDKFKGSLDAWQVCEAIKLGLRNISNKFQIHMVPLADGGEGTCHVLTTLSGGTKVECKVCDPLFRKIKASFGVSVGGETAFIESASASGFELLKDYERDPMVTTSFGTGEMILHAIDRGVKQVILGIGGTATNDAGIGIANALGYKFLDANGNELSPIGKNLKLVNSIQPAELTPAIANIAFVSLCDVTNPLFGQEGAARVFARQKGADEEAVRWLDDGLRNIYKVVKRDLSVDINFPGAGAGGGISAGAFVFLKSKLKRGINFLFEFAKFEESVKNADVIITGEGKVDRQTLAGKVIKGVSSLALKHGKPLYVIAGKNELSDQELQQLGIAKLITLINQQTTEQEAMTRGYDLIRQRITDQLLPLL